MPQLIGMVKKQKGKRTKQAGGRTKQAGGRTKKQSGGILSGYNVRHNPIGLLTKQLKSQIGSGRGSAHRTIFKRDENGLLMFKDPRHI
jgi:hypothetical protein